MTHTTINLYPASLKTLDGTKWGYINKKGELVSKPLFDYAMDFQENGLAVVERYNKYGIINERGKYVVKPQFLSISEFSEGRAVVLDYDGYHVINEQGKILTTKPYSFIGSYQDKRALFSLNENNQLLYGYLDLEGNEIIPASFLSASDFLNGQAIIQKDDQTSALLNQSGQVLYTYPYPTVTNLGEGLLSFKESSEFDAKVGVMDTKGTVILSPRYTWIQPFKDRRAIITVAEEYRNPYGLIDTKGNVVIQPIYNDIQLLGETRVALGKAIKEEEPYKGSYYAIADNVGRLLTDFIYTSVLPFEENVASASDSKRTFFINKDGRQATGLPVLKGSGTLAFEGDLIKATINQRVSYYSREGKEIWKQNSVIPLNRHYLVKEKKYNPREDYVVYYPQIEGMTNTTTQRKVNDQLKKMSQEQKIDNDELQDYTYSADFNVEFFKGILLVLKLEAYQYPIGAAHGMPFKNYPHINLKTGKFYQLEDLFKNNQEYIKVLSDIIGNQIKNDPTYSYVFPDAYKGISKDQPFYVSSDALYLYFAPYEIAPYAAGFPTFKIYYKEISDILNKQGEFWRSFH
ncbi:WG repeat-containing protein [Bacillus pinisoli]|uniref:WG repeat-containing protein n=1 Tax=Bacillus pinisoli TaxID=2901866 RepID=UPI001FF49851|nr:WG repeat-containing protein [Bacillus pinisoli]